MATSVTEFLETYRLYQRFRPGTAVGWNGQWPDAVEVPCRRCSARRPHRIWPTRVAGFTPDWGVYMIQGTCARCGHNGLIFWVEVNQRERWMRKAGQLPGALLAEPEPSVPLV